LDLANTSEKPLDSPVSTEIIPVGLQALLQLVLAM
jgi:hypothetical protein